MNFLGIDIGGSAIKAAVVEMRTGREDRGDASRPKEATA